MRAVGPIAIFLDLVESSLLSLVLFIVSPIQSAKCLTELNKIYLGVKVLSRNGVLASTIRATIDIRMQRFDRAITILESALAVVEDSHFEQAQEDSEAVLEFLFAWIARTYLQLAQIDDAALTVIRANKSIGVTKLANVGELDVKTAHIVKAGLAAGRLLDENGTATFMVQAGELDQRRKRRHQKKRSLSETVTGKIIPFPMPQKP